MEIGNIVTGHVNEFLGLHKDIKGARLAVCKLCPLYYHSAMGWICNHKLYLDPETNDVSLNKKDGYVRGCGCRLDAKTTLVNASCPAGKW